MTCAVWALFQLLPEPIVTDYSDQINCHSDAVGCICRSLTKPQVEDHSVQAHVGSSTYWDLLDWTPGASEPCRLLHSYCAYMPDQSK